MSGTRHEPVRGTAPEDSRDLDAELVAFLDGEADRAGRRAVRRRLRRDPEARLRLRILRSTGAALHEALAAPTSWRRLAGPALLAAAALAVVLAVWSTAGRGGEAAAVGNGLVELHVAPRGGASQPLFTDLAIELRWRARQGHRIHVLPAAADGDPAAQAAEFAARPEARPDDLPLRLAFSVRGPDGRVLPARWAGTPFVAEPAGEALQTIPLRALQVDDPRTARPYLAGWFGDGGWREDFVRPTMLGGQALLPAEPGAWQIDVAVATLPAADRGWPEFAAPLEARTGFVLTGRVSEWSAPVDGLRARIAVSDCGDPDHMPIALQIENTGDRTREYNVTGVTQVEVPQPLHFQLWVDGEEWQQREDLPVVHSHQTLHLPHPPGAVRTCIAMADYWRRDGRRLGGLTGRHELQFRFHSRMLVWDPDDAALWQGVLTTPAVGIAVPDGR